MLELLSQIVRTDKFQYLNKLQNAEVVASYTVSLLKINDGFEMTFSLNGDQLNYATLAGLCEFSKLQIEQTLKDSAYMKLNNMEQYIASLAQSTKQLATFIAIQPQKGDTIESK